MIADEWVEIGQAWVLMGMDLHSQGGDRRSKCGCLPTSEPSLSGPRQSWLTMKCRRSARAARRAGSLDHASALARREMRADTRCGAFGNGRLPNDNPVLPNDNPVLSDGNIVLPNGNLVLSDGNFILPNDNLVLPEDKTLQSGADEITSGGPDDSISTI